jgi:hypothetical protein
LQIAIHDGQWRAKLVHGRRQSDRAAFIFVAEAHANTAKLVGRERVETTLQVFREADRLEDLLGLGRNLLYGGGGGRVLGHNSSVVKVCWYCSQQAPGEKRTIPLGG